MLAGFRSEIKGAVSNNKEYNNNSNILLSSPISDTSSRLTSQRNDPNHILCGNNYNGFPVIIVESIRNYRNLCKLHPSKVGNLYYFIINLTVFCKSIRLDRRLNYYLIRLIQLTNAYVLHFYTIWISVLA